MHIAHCTGQAGRNVTNAKPLAEVILILYNFDVM